MFYQMVVNNTLLMLQLINVVVCVSMTIMVSMAVNELIKS